MRRALVTGGSGDIGSAICRQLARDGFEVIVHAFNRPDRAELVARFIREQGGSASSISFDVTLGDHSRTALEGLLGDGPVQVVVSNAGIHDDTPMPGMSADQWHRVVDVSLNGFYNVVQPLLLPMLKTRWGRVIALSSVAGVIGNRGQANYAAAKSGLHGAIKSLSLELASRGVTANAVAPGIIQGDLTDSVFSEEQIRQMVPARRVGTPEEVASLAGFLASEQAGYISGQVIGINGGMA